jgi:uncharacterized protein
MPMPPAPDLSLMSLAEVAKALAEQRLPPVDQWHPAHCGDSEMRIARDGTWYHQGGRIDREAMVRLFASLLRQESDGSFVLVTPAEKLDIIVEDAPFIAVEVKSDGAGEDRKITFRLNTADLIVAGADHALRFADAPYIHVRGGMEAKIARPVYYELAALALDEGNEPNGLWSNGAFFPMAVA